MVSSFIIQNHPASSCFYVLGSFTFLSCRTASLKKMSFANNKKKRFPRTESFFPFILRARAAERRQSNSSFFLQCESLEASPCLVGHCTTAVPFLEAAAGPEPQDQRSPRREEHIWQARRRCCRRRRGRTPGAGDAPAPPRPRSRRRPPREASPGPSSGICGTCTIPSVSARGSGSTPTP